MNSHEVPVDLARQTVYRFLQQAFDFPNLQLVGVLQDENFPASLRLMAECLGLSEKAVDEMLQSFDGYKDEALLEDLAIEYTRLFINAYPKAVAVPYARVYLGEGSSCSKEPEIYWKKAGVVLDPQWRDLSDHIVAEFGFMNYLIKQTDKEARFQKLQGEFIRDHLACWAPVFFKNIITGSRHRFYGALAELAAEFFKWEQEFFEAA